MFIFPLTLGAESDGNLWLKLQTYKKSNVTPEMGLPHCITEGPTVHCISSRVSFLTINNSFPSIKYYFFPQLQGISSPLTGAFRLTPDRTKRNTLSKLKG